MASFVRGMRVGMGLVSLGWGVCRLARGKRDWVTTATLTTGASMVFPNTAEERTPIMGRRMRPMAPNAAVRAAGEAFARAADALI